MSKHDPRVTLRQIEDYARHAQTLCAGRTLAQIKADWRDAFAFERVMEVLGEAVKRLPDELRSRYPAIDWRGIAGMRDRVSHGYDTVDYDVLWKAVQERVPSPPHHRRANAPGLGARQRQVMPLAAFSLSASVRPLPSDGRESGGEGKPGGA